MPVIIPERFAEKMRSDAANKAYEGHINALIQNTCALITEKADFFPEYTIHGWPHIQAVLNHADKLIPDVTMEVLSGRDIALLIAAVILHDMGMFLEKAGARKLLTGSRSTTKTAKLDRYDWKNEWDRYIREIRRYPEEKLLYHFGISCAIEEPDLVKGEFSDLDLLVVGDFLRRHHHRIAHEIALGAMPGDTDVDVMQVSIDALGNTAFNMKDRKCIGILARSHGMPIRETREYIKWEMGSKYIEKLFYLMAVLRIADALDADERRAPDTRRKLQGIHTPVSVQEWIWNQRITRTDLDWDDAVDFKYIEAEPESTTEFVQLEKWLKWIQSELDLSWAVLSECCDTQKYRLSIHRIESNILEEERRESYGEKFITKDARLNANPEMLKLLVAPLYNNRPSYGVRELLQNAVDACNERAHLEGDGYRGQVQIRLDTIAETLTVTDNGIGMDENVLLNYYLCAGASYRTSEEWFEKFATDRDSNIVRTGRFGVGVLATFLLGNTVEVTTRHMDDELGYTFQFSLEPESLNIKRPAKVPEIGTTIKVKLKNKVASWLDSSRYLQDSWTNWFRFAEPSVRYWRNNRECINNKPPVPQDDHEVSGWFALQQSDYDGVYWGYPEDGFFCNGIIIPGLLVRFDPIILVGTHDERIHLPQPSISVIDKKGHFPLDLSRSYLLDNSVLHQVEQEARRYALAQLLTADWSSPNEVCNRFGNGIWEYKNKKNAKPLSCICSSNGYSFLELAICLTDGDLSFLEFFCKGDQGCRKFLSMLRQIEPELPFMVYPIGSEISEYRHAQISFNSAMCEINRYRDYTCSIERVWSDSVLYQTLVNQKSDIRIVNHFRPKQERGCYIEYVSDKVMIEQAQPPVRLDQLDTSYCRAITEIKVPHHRHKDIDYTMPVLLDLVQTYMGGDPWIPYDMEDRRKKFPKAFAELKYYIDRILADREKERGAQNA